MEPMEPTPAPPADVSAEPVRCTWCDAAEVERIAQWGPQLLTEQYICLACHSPFEWIRKR
jgi:hypothetical protein